MGLEQQVYTIVFAPLLGAVVAGFGCKKLSKNVIHCVTILLVFISMLLSIKLFYGYVSGSSNETFNFNLYRWALVGNVDVNVGFLIDSLTTMMLVVVTSISFLVHIYSIGYMHDDSGDRRFFSYISLFTFAMLMLVTANNFMQLFFGWEAVGLVSYLLIGFWYQKDTAIFANMKAFLVNRVGDFGFILGIGAIFYCFGTLDYKVFFASLSSANLDSLSIPGINVNVITLICLSLFVGAMGKSAQVPLHVWLPDSMEGPTPISALIHAATMVTAGIFMVARLSPLFELSDTALTVIMTIGAITCFFMGLLGLVQNDIKRIVAYSTLSQLGYMVTALGASAYAISIFHLYTHAFFKALLFLGAGGVIVALHHQQNIFKMGNLRKYMPKTYISMLIGSLSLAGFPFLSGFYSKDLIIEAVKYSQLPVSNFAYYSVLFSVFVTSLYSFRLLFLVFHTDERMDLHDRDHLSDGHWSIWLPVAILAIPSIFAGYFAVPHILGGLFDNAIYVAPQHTSIAMIKKHFHGAYEMGLHGVSSVPFALLACGIISAWVVWGQKSNIASLMQRTFRLIYKIMINKYGFDLLNERVIAPLVGSVGNLFWRLGDVFVIDGLIVRGIPKVIARLGLVVRHMQTGFLYHYVLVMIIGIIILVYFAGNYSLLSVLNRYWEL